MPKSISITADLIISSDSHQIIILSSADEIGIAITGDSIPKFGISPFKALKLLKGLPAVEMDQLVTVVFNQKEIYRSDKSLFKQSNIFLLVRVFFKNLF
ncbi:hypothetical protein [Algoriphagus antarcticus]|uniref:Uncharacterized protein n=1 Tax=Algoriphagus antarcticus TaxID=238540 RepID=A0A3E0DRE4_9BACT|nr:hypothetical protein [Algoriphagus antarcticus]REG84441.1 hypothetical protein C8N25_11515 [Algoriphagus antarcticus]